MKDKDYEQKYYDFVDSYSAEAHKHLNTVVELNWANIQRDELTTQVQQLQQQVLQLQQQARLMPAPDPFDPPSQETVSIAASTTSTSTHTPVDWKGWVRNNHEQVSDIMGVASLLCVVLVTGLWLRRARVIKQLDRITPRWRDTSNKRTTPAIVAGSGG